MQEEAGVRWPWLKFLYWYTLLGGGAVGVVVIVTPGLFASLFRMPAQDPYMLGVAGSFWLVSGLVAIFGLRAPLVFAPTLLVQLAYKSTWLLGVFLPHLLAGAVPVYGWAVALVFSSYVVLDLIAIPFARILAR